MIFLVLSILLLTSFGLVVKRHQAAGRNLLAVGAINYAFAAVAAAVFVVYTGSYEISVTTCVIGILAGLAYSISYYLMIYTIKSSGISIAWSAIRLSVIVPVLFSIFYWNERPSIYQIAGIVFVCIALPLLSIKPDSDGRRRMFGRASVLVLMLFIATSGVNLAPKAFSELSPESHRQMYLLLLFTTAAIVSCCAMIFKEPSMRATDVPVGVALGLLNLSSRYFLLLALVSLPGIVVFPISGSAGIVLMTLAGMAIWRERIRKLNALGIAFAVAAVVLINLK